MKKLISILNEILEATASIDRQSSKQAIEVFNKIKSWLYNTKNYSKFNLTKFLNGKAFVISLDKIGIKFKKEYNLSIALFGVGKSVGSFGSNNKTNNIIALYILNNGLLDYYINSYDVGYGFNNKNAEKSFLQDIKKNLNKDVFIHEFIHYLDSLRQSQDYKMKSGKYAAQGDVEKYYNDSSEMNAYFQEAIRKMYNDLSLKKSKEKTRIIRTLNKMFIEGFDYFESEFFMGYANKNWRNSLNNDNMKKVLLRLYKHWEDFKNKYLSYDDIFKLNLHIIQNYGYSKQRKYEDYYKEKFSGYLKLAVEKLPNKYQVLINNEIKNQFKKLNK